MHWIPGSCNSGRAGVFCMEAVAATINLYADKLYMRLPKKAKLVPGVIAERNLFVKELKASFPESSDGRLKQLIND